MAEKPWVVDVDERDFEREVLLRSREVPVVVDFWAAWCGPCRVLGPVLERLAAEHAGAFVLAKVDVDRAPALAQAYAVRSIPAVKGFRAGGIVAELTGAQPETVVRRFLAAVLPTAADRLARAAEALAAGGDVAAAEAQLRAALAEEPRHAPALLGLARLLADRGALAEAQALLERVPPNASVAPEAERLAAELRTRLDGAGDEAALRARVVAEPGDLAARLALGRALAAKRQYETALTQLLEVVRRDVGFEDGAARKAMVDVFAVLGSDDPLVDRYRGELAKLLYR
ncbi:MAG TPA: tetratricopeptide repeat protein [Candidatus Binatia bacterium]|nr:tetratricopeptide repeat protein [Candidatus Binatia bacterium]